MLSVFWTSYSSKYSVIPIEKWWLGKEVIKTNMLLIIRYNK